MSVTDQPLLLDHVVIGVHDRLDQAAEIYRRLGFRLTLRGYHTLGSINHLAIFGETYLELLGFPAGGEPARTAVWSYPPGLSGLAFKTRDAAALQGALAAAGKPVEAWQDFSRPVEVDGEQKPARFRTFQLGRDVVTNGRFFFCQHDTPELVWRDTDRGHPNGVEEITDVFIVSRDAKALLSLFDGFPEPATPQAAEGEIRVRAGAATLRILTEEAAGARFGDAIPAGFEGAYRLVALALKTASLDTASKALAAGGFAPRALDGGLLVEAEAANGVALWFRA